MSRLLRLLSVAAACFFFTQSAAAISCEVVQQRLAALRAQEAEVRTQINSRYRCPDHQARYAFMVDSLRINSIPWATIDSFAAAVLYALDNRSILASLGTYASAPKGFPLGYAYDFHLMLRIEVRAQGESCRTFLANWYPIWKSIKYYEAIAVYCPSTIVPQT